MAKKAQAAFRRRDEINAVYTDGSCKLQMGAWAWWNPDSCEFESGCEAPSTNQRMELYAAIDAIDHHLDLPGLVIVSDSRYLVDCINQRWYERWQKNGWKNADGQEVANAELWRQLIGLIDAYGEGIGFEWVRGHNGDPGNEYVDAIARQMMELALGDA